MDFPPNKAIRIVFFGTSSFVIPVARALEKHSHLVGIVTAGDKKVGRQQLLSPSAVKMAYQQDYQNSPKSNFILKILTPNKLDAFVARQLAALQPDLIVVASYGQIIPQEILDIPRFGALNIHPSLLPKYRGASPIQSTILNGDRTSGVTIIKMDAQVDHGPIIYTKEVSLSNKDTFKTLSNKMFIIGANALIKIIPKFIQGKLTPKSQNDSQATYCSLLKKTDGYIDIKNPPDNTTLNRMIRAYYPWPIVWTLFSQGLKKQAKIVKFFPGGLVQMEGKKIIPFTDFLRGQPTFPIKKIQ